MATEERNLVKYSSELNNQALDLTDKELNVFFAVIGMFSHDLSVKELYVGRGVLKEYSKYKRTGKQEFINLCLGVAEKVNNSTFVRKNKSNADVLNKQFNMFDTFEYIEDGDSFYIVLNKDYRFLIDNNYLEDKSTTTLDYNIYKEITNKYAKHLYCLLAGFKYSNLFIMDKKELYRIMCLPAGYKENKKKAEIKKAVEVCSKYIKNCRLSFERSGFGNENVVILMRSREFKTKEDKDKATKEELTDILDLTPAEPPAEAPAPIEKEKHKPAEAEAEAIPSGAYVPVRLKNNKQRARQKPVWFDKIPAEPTTQEEAEDSLEKLIGMMLQGDSLQNSERVKTEADKTEADKTEADKTEADKTEADNKEITEIEKRYREIEERYEKKREKAYKDIDRNWFDKIPAKELQKIDFNNDGQISQIRSKLKFETDRKLMEEMKMEKAKIEEGKS